MTPKEGKREQKERGLSGQLTLSLRPQTCTSPSPRALHTAMQRQPTHNHPATRLLSRGNTGASLEQNAPHPRPSLGPSRSLDHLSQVLPHIFFWPRGGTKPLQYRAAANPPAVAPSFACRRLISRFRTAHSRALLSHSVPDEPGLLPPPLASPCQLRGPPLAASAAASPFFPRWALGGARELGPPPGSCFRHSLVGWDGDGCCGKEEEAEAGTDGHLSTLRSAALQDCVL